MKFDWNPDKAKENEQKHDGITFDEAVEVFYDPTAFEDYDDKHSDSIEIRFLRIGNSAKRFLRVSFTIREDETAAKLLELFPPANVERKK